MQIKITMSKNFNSYSRRHQLRLVSEELRIELESAHDETAANDFRPIRFINDEMIFYDESLSYDPITDDLQEVGISAEKKNHYNLLSLIMHL